MLLVLPSLQTQVKLQLREVLEYTILPGLPLTTSDKNRSGSEASLSDCSAKTAGTSNLWKATGGSMLYKPFNSHSNNDCHCAFGWAVPNVTFFSYI